MTFWWTSIATANGPGSGQSPGPFAVFQGGGVPGRILVEG
jgi:hypothetical protein